MTASPGEAGNRLRDPRDRRLPRVPGPCAVVVFGVTGDLSRKKLIPAIYDLGNRGLLPPGFVLLGFARRDWDVGDFESLAREAAKKYARTEFRDDVWRRIADSLVFLPGAFDDDEAFDTLASTLTELEASHGIQGNA
ncbi:MAG TPA: glucose-6-phosphate dehydrogenase, partial [Acidimicrobiales bacterium]|nr:glucose-6-phosphate dehydrogenase [Acidimicrobiales bacterium]